jgi:hypothetical protein
MKALSQSSSSLKDAITEFLKKYKSDRDGEQPSTLDDDLTAFFLRPLDDDLTAFFLRLRDDPDRRIDEIWKKIVADNPSIDTTSGRESFLKELTDPWDYALLADNAARVRAYRRTLQDEETKIKKALIRSLSKTSGRKLLADLHDAITKLQPFAKFEEIYEGFCRAELYPLVNIRSSRAGSRIRTVFMRTASHLMHRTTGKWHDDEVATLTDIAFPGEEATTIRMVQSARQSIRRTT